MIKVLIVEDEDFVRKGIRYAFDWMKLGCVIVDEAINGKDGVEKINKHKPDLVITDLKMPKMNGIDMIKSIEKRDFQSIILTGYAEFEYAQQAIELGVSEFLLKPIDEKKFEETIKNVVDVISEQKKLNKIKSKINDFDNIEVLDEKLCLKNSNFKSKYTEMIIDYITKEYGSKISINQITDHIGVGATYLSKKFKEDTACTIHDFINRYRIRRALELMETKDMKIYEIADKVGFSEYKYFSQVFKNYINYSPSEFMKSDIYINKINSKNENTF